MFTKRGLSLFALNLMVSALTYGAAEGAADKTGTNPINFTNDFRVYNEFTQLNTKGDGEQNITTVEYRTPLMDGKWQFRARVRGGYTQADVTGDGKDDIDTSGLGTVDFRFLTVPYVNMKKKVAVAVGIETILPTGTKGIGSETLSFGPQVFGVYFMPLGIKNSLIAPAYQHKFSVYGEDDNGADDDVNQSLFDIFFLKTSSDKQFWMLVNPSYVIDHETQQEYGVVDVEVGMMLDDWIDAKGHSVYLRPSIGWGTDRATDGSLEVGYKIIW